MNRWSRRNMLTKRLIISTTVALGFATQMAQAQGQNIMMTRGDMPMPDPVTMTQAAPQSATTMTDPANRAVAPATDHVVAAGPMQEKRQQLYNDLQQAKTQGIGITMYMMGFDAMEDRVKAGDTETKIAERVNMLSQKLNEQFKRSNDLKTQRPTPPVQASNFGGMDLNQLSNMGAPPGPGGMSNIGGMGGMGGSKMDDVIAKLKNKYGGQIPDSLKNQIPGGLGGVDPSTLLSNPNLKDILKGLKQ